MYERGVVAVWRDLKNSPDDVLFGVNKSWSEPTI